MLEKILKLFPKTIEGTVLDISLNENYPVSTVTEIIGMYHDGTAFLPEKETYIVGRYRVIVQDSEGNQIEAEYCGKPFEIGTKQRFKGHYI